MKTEKEIKIKLLAIYQLCQKKPEMLDYFKPQIELLEDILEVKKLEVKNG